MICYEKEMKLKEKNTKKEILYMSFCVIKRDKIIYKDLKNMF